MTLSMNIYFIYIYRERERETNLISLIVSIYYTNTIYGKFTFLFVHNTFFAHKLYPFCAKRNHLCTFALARKLILGTICIRFVQKGTTSAPSSARWFLYKTREFCKLHPFCEKRNHLCTLLCTLLCTATINKKDKSA